MSFLKISPFIQRIYEGNLVNTARDVQPRAKNFAERMDQLWLRIKAQKMSKEQIQKIPPKAFWWKTGKASSAMGIFGLGVIYHSFQSTDFVVPDNIIPSKGTIQGPDSPITKTGTSFSSSTLTFENFNSAGISFPVGVGVLVAMAAIAVLGYKFFEHPRKEFREENTQREVTFRSKGSVDHQDPPKGEGSIFNQDLPDVPGNRASLIQQDRPLLKTEPEGSTAKKKKKLSFSFSRQSLELSQDSSGKLSGRQSLGLSQDSGKLSRRQSFVIPEDSEQDRLPKDHPKGQDEQSLKKKFDGIKVRDYVSENESTEEDITKKKQKSKAIEIKESFDKIRAMSLTPDEETQVRRGIYENIYKHSNSLDDIFDYLSGIEKVERYFIKADLFDFLIDSFGKNSGKEIFELNAKPGDIPENIDLARLLLGWNTDYEDNKGAFETFLDTYCQQVIASKKLYNLFIFVKFLDATAQIEDEDSDEEDRRTTLEQLRDLRADSIRKISESIANLKNYPQNDRNFTVAIATIFAIDAKYLCQSLDDKKGAFQSTFEALKIDCDKITQLLEGIPSKKAALLLAFFTKSLMTNRPQLYDWVLSKLEVLQQGAQFKLYEEYLNSAEQEKVNVGFIEKYLTHLKNKKLFVQLVSDVEKCLNKGIVTKTILELMETGLLRLEGKEEISCLNKCLNLCKDNCEMSKSVIEIILRRLRKFVPKDVNELLPSLKDALSILEVAKPFEAGRLRKELQKFIPQLNKPEVTTALQVV